MTRLLSVLLAGFLTLSPSYAETLSQDLLDAEAAYEAAWEAAPFALRTVVLAKRIDGIGDYQARSDNRFRVGDEIVIYAEPVAFGYRNSGGGHDIAIDASLELSTTTGQSLGVLSGIESLRAGSALRLKDIHIETRLTVPELPDGQYEIRYTLDDLAGGQSASHVFEIEVISD